MRRVVLLLGVALCLSLAAPVGGAAQVGRERPEISLHRARPHAIGPLEVGSVARRSLERGYLVPDEAGYARAKRQASVAPSTKRTLATADTPTVAISWEGVHDVRHTPSDSTGAIGVDRYIEVVNTKVAIYRRNGRLVASTSLGRWWNTGRARTADPQILWDPTTERFYYAGIALFGATDNELAFGWSMTSSPAHLTTGWCSFAVRYGAELPDYPKLGDTADFALIGVNAFTEFGFRGADVVAIGKPGKPAAGETCPVPGSDPIPFGVGQNLSALDLPQYTPVPANQVDGVKTGYVVTRSLSFSATTIGLFSVTADPEGNPVIETTGRAVTVPRYSVPPNAPQADMPFLLDTLDGRFTQAVSARDPSHGGVAIWTQHTIAGGAGSLVRWYEIDPIAGTVVQTGDVANDSLYAFNGAIAPDRAVRGATKRFGSSMVMGFNTSSSTTYPAVQMVSKVGARPQSGWTLVQESPGPDLDFACADIGYCRWGDYAGASPDPNPGTSGTGTVWLSGMWTSDGRLLRRGTSWRTVNWAALP